jgi:hypothetical protein
VQKSSIFFVLLIFLLALVTKQIFAHCYTYDEMSCARGGLFVKVLGWERQLLILLAMWIGEEEDVRIRFQPGWLKSMRMRSSLDADEI